MLPDMRAVFAALVAALGLLMIAFGAVAALRVAQESHAGSFQADLARRGQIVLPKPPQRVAVIETPGPHLAPPPPLPVVEVKIAPVGAEVSAIPVARETVQETVQNAPPVAVAAQREDEPVTVAEAPVGGPLAAPTPAQSEAHRAAVRAERAKKLAAARKAREAREARMARQRKAAAVRRAAQARAKQQAQPTQSFNTGFGSSGFGDSFRSQ